MSNSRSKPTVERRKGAKSNALRMLCPPHHEQGGRSAVETASTVPSPGPNGARRRKIWMRCRRFQDRGRHVADGTQPFIERAFELWHPRVAWGLPGGDMTLKN